MHEDSRSIIPVKNHNFDNV